MYSASGYDVNMSQLATVTSTCRMNGACAETWWAVLCLLYRSAAAAVVMASILRGCCAPWYFGYKGWTIFWPIRLLNCKNTGYSSLYSAQIGLSLKTRRKNAPEHSIFCRTSKIFQNSLSRTFFHWEGIALPFWAPTNQYRCFSHSYYYHIFYY